MEYILSVLRAIEPYGTVGLSIVAVVAIIYFYAQNQKTVTAIEEAAEGKRPPPPPPPGGWGGGGWGGVVAAVAILGVVALSVLNIFFPTRDGKPVWVSVYAQADWGGHDRACSATAAPKVKFCDEQHLGQVASCWSNRTKGYPSDPTYPKNPNFVDCQNEQAWCTYKDEGIRVTTLQNPSPGVAEISQTYVCVAGSALIKQ